MIYIIELFSELLTKLGFSLGMANLGLMYYRGLGTAKDDVKKCNLYYKCRYKRN